MAALPDVSGSAGVALPQREVRTKSNQNPIHVGEHDGFPCTKCKKSLGDLSSRLPRMSTRPRADVISELMSDRGMRVSSFYFDRLIGKLLGSTQLPEGLDRKRMNTASFRRNLPAILAALDPSLDDGDDMPAPRGRESGQMRRGSGRAARRNIIPTSHTGGPMLQVS